MKTLTKLSLIVFLFSMISCSTGKKALQHGDYTTAVMQAVERLRDNPNSKKSIETLSEAYPMALSTLQIEANQILQSNEALKYAQVVQRFESIQKMAEAIRRCPAAYKVIGEPETFPEQLASARDKAAPESYDAAMKLINQGSREAAKDAYYLFLDVNRYKPGFRDVAKMIKESKMQATLKVLVEPIPVSGRYKLSSQFFYDQVYQFLYNGVRNDFVEFYSPAEAKKLPYVDDILEIEFYDFVVGATSNSDSEKEYTSRDSVKVGTATVDGRKVDVYNRVKASYKLFRREVTSTGVLTVRIVNAATNKVRRERRFPGTYQWVSEWATFTGDKRALNKQQIDMTKLKPGIPPPPQTMFREFTRPIFDQIKPFIRSYYRNL